MPRARAASQGEAVGVIGGLEIGPLASLVSAGGVTVLAVLVYLELRAIRPVLRSLDRAVVALLERDRDRSAGIIRRDPTPLPRLETGGNDR